MPAGEQLPAAGRWLVVADIDAGIDGLRCSPSTVISGPLVAGSTLGSSKNFSHRWFRKSVVPASAHDKRSRSGCL